MDGTAIERIEKLCEPHIIGEYGYEYCDKELKVVKTPKAETIRLHTLSGLVQVLRKECINFDAPVIVNVDCEEYVRVYSAIDSADRGREIPYDVAAELIEIPFNRRLDYETMMITLKSKFVETQASRHDNRRKQCNCIGRRLYTVCSCTQGHCNEGRQDCKAYR